jgi:hypothetical protein
MRVPTQLGCGEALGQTPEGIGHSFLACDNSIGTRPPSTSTLFLNVVTWQECWGIEPRKATLLATLLPTKRWSATLVFNFNRTESHLSQRLYAKCPSKFITGTTRLAVLWSISHTLGSVGPFLSRCLGRLSPHSPEKCDLVFRWMIGCLTSLGQLFWWRVRM